MRALRNRLVLTLLGAAVAAAPLHAAEQREVEGAFVVGGAEAGLSHARATRVELEKGKPGYAVLLSAAKAEGEIAPWRTGDPKERGSFIVLLLEESGAVWVAEIGHAAAKTGRFGVVTEVAVRDLKIDGGQLRAHVTTNGDQEFGEDRYRIDLRVAAPLEK